MRCLVTGGAGFIGSNLALELEKHNEVVVVDSFLKGSMKNLDGFKGKIVEQDISGSITIGGKFDAVFHLAAITDTTFPDDIVMFRQNINSFLNALEFAKKSRAKFIYASSAAVYGNTTAPSREDGPFNPLNAYGASKRACDIIAERFMPAMHIVGLHYFNVFGPRESFKAKMASMIFQLYQQMKSGNKPRIFYDGEQKRDHVYVKDVVKATILAASAKSSRYNVGTGIATSFNEIIRFLNGALGTSLEPDYIENPYKASYQGYTQADLSSSKKLLGFNPDYSVKEGIIDYVGWLEND